MFRKKLLSGVIVGVMFFSFSTSAFAQLISVSVGIPTSFSFSESDTKVDGTPSGFLAHVKLPILVGVGYESYQVPIDVSTADTKVAYTMYDLFYTLPIPIISVTFGLGMGTAKVECSACSTQYDDAVATQYYGQLGFPILGIIGLHVSYHSLSAKAKATSGSGEADLGGTMMAVGMSLGF